VIINKIYLAQDGFVISSPQSAVADVSHPWRVTKAVYNMIKIYIIKRDVGGLEESLIVVKYRNKNGLLANIIVPSSLYNTHVRLFGVNY
jgi:hypothetical protein